MITLGANDLLPPLRCIKKRKKLMHRQPCSIEIVILPIGGTVWKRLRAEKKPASESKNDK